MRKVIFVTSNLNDIRRLVYESREVWDITAAANIFDAPERIESEFYDCVLFDIGLTGGYAPDLLSKITSIENCPPVFILSREYAYCFITLSYRLGASGYFHIPYTFANIAEKLEQYFTAAKNNDHPGKNPDSTEEILFQNILGSSGVMERVRRDILQIRDRNEPVLIYGETGSGKELVAKMVHTYSPVSEGQYMASNVSCIPDTLAESLLFGTARGSFTDAQNKQGLFEHADGGTLFLDEIAELPIFLQPKFLRVLEEKQVTRLGEAKKRKVSFRLICATNRNMTQAVKSGLFREDLFYRLDVLRIQVPPLRTHLEDIPELSAFCLKKYSKKLSSAALDKLQAYKWPGNVRQLFNCLTRAACLSQDNIIYPDKIQF
ncbi:sigma-54 dependent transcriptional regulator [Brucepastera parasyntrophica]|uniref:sigma-54-dependent transcriptional regulator n=1 Tax=Brucepastera parasyntrophica TaxID=2880008 RepID=UPI00210C2D59|nr:sigma-54 dependent transcriptional regulator [Brucepastera parasyntrophica]ULQ60887.1 sigma-54 dependent transcriptional regulator [Brucepastera parasyntrophica]